jgi:outer membrane protein
MRTLPVIFLCCLFMTAVGLFAQEPELSLSEAIRIALDNNRPAKILELDITKAEWAVASTKTKRLPSFSMYFFGSGTLTSPTWNFPANTFQTSDHQPVPATDTKISYSQGFTGLVTAEASQPLSQLYKIGLAIHEQELDVDLSRQKYEAKRQAVVADVKQAYYAVLQTESSLGAAAATVKQYQETDRVVLDYVAQRSVLKSSSLDVKAKLAQAQYQVIQLNDTLQTQKEKLNFLMGRDLDVPLRTQQVPPEQAEEIDLKVARQTALSRRPEIKEAEIDTQRADYDSRLAKSQYIPDVGAAFHYTSPFNTSILPQNIASAGFEVRWEPFEWGRRRDDVKQKDVVVEQSKYQLDEARSQILLEVDSSFRKLVESRSLLVAAEAARAAANEKLREVNDKFKESAVLLRDVLDQEAAVAAAENDYEESLLAFWSAKASFEKALGEE